MDVFTFWEHLAKSLRPHAVVWGIGFDRFKCILGAFPPAFYVDNPILDIILTITMREATRCKWGQKVTVHLHKKRDDGVNITELWFLLLSLDSHWSRGSRAWGTLTASEQLNVKHSDVYSHNHCSTCPCVIKTRRHTPVFLQDNSHQSLAMVALNFHEGVRRKTTTHSYVHWLLLHIKILHTRHILVLNVFQNASQNVAHM